MSLVAHHARVLAYDAWANRAVQGGLAAAPAAPAKALGLLAHVLGAQELWLARLSAAGIRAASGGAERPAVWPTWDAARSAAAAVELAGRWKALLASLAEGDLDRKVSYRNSLGQDHTSTVGDILTHVETHGAYHRGQIAALLRAAGVEPAYTDFAHASRGHLFA